MATRRATQNDARPLPRVVENGERKVTHPFLALGDRWREKAVELRRLGADTQAHVLEVAAEDMRAMMEERIDPVTAGEETPHLSEHTIRNKLSSGEIENWGKRGAPLVRRGDLWGLPKRGPRHLESAVRRRVAGGR